MCSMLTLTDSISSPSHCMVCRVILDTSRLLIAPQVILCVDLPGHKVLQPPTLALCSASSYPRAHQWTILALSAEFGNSRVSGRLPKLKTAGRSKGWGGGRGVEGLGGRTGSERRRRERKQGREGGRWRGCVYNFGKHRKQQHWEQTFLSWLLPFGHFHISSKTSVLTVRRRGMIICFLY